MENDKPKEDTVFIVSDEIKMARCHSCMFWFCTAPKICDETYGTCHRRAPVAKLSNDDSSIGYTIWPVTMACDGCAEGVEIPKMEEKK